MRFGPFGWVSGRKRYRGNYIGIVASFETMVKEMPKIIKIYIVLTNYINFTKVLQHIHYYIILFDKNVLHYTIFECPSACGS